MEKNEALLQSEEDDETPKQSPQSSQTWPMDKIRQSRFQQKMSSLSSQVTPKRSYNAKSLLLQCLRDSKSDPLPRRRFPDEGILMDGVLVTSATAKKLSDSPSSFGSLGRSSVVRKNTEFSSPRSHSIRSQLQYQAQSYTYPRSSQGPPPAYLQVPASLHGPHLYPTHHQSPRPTGYQIPHHFNQSPIRISLPSSPFASTPNTSRRPPLHTPISGATNSAANLRTSTTTNGSRLGLSPSVDGLDVVTTKPDLSSPSDGLGTKSSTSARLQTVTTKKDWSPSDDGLPTFTQAQADFVKSQDRVLPDCLFQQYKYTKRLPVFTLLCLDDKTRV